ncbi:MAG: 2-C-methyl-D-erythritol 4-phosphate cytidylyltransferase [Sphaerochaetaceae bacterium]|nr:2-C-methyl-D-erythritol 4-phosphate cytidylyltransferase [Sphaerochaetaceae bacterium]MDC7248988.1 2-C-methyl-D-erythritol 4-phosphate cytidylyltransferase [Sphaerochaetaceae bacterium]
MTNNVYAVILAGGVGKRMGNTETPKQFKVIAGKPVIIHTVEKFVINPKFDKVIILVPSQWIRYTNDIINKYIPNPTNIVVIEGGKERYETLMNSINYIESNFEIDDETVIVTHDAVRPFIDCSIINNNITLAQKYGACDTVIPATDTIVESTDNDIISKIPNRKIMYQGQTPQSFNLKLIKKIYLELSDEERMTLTDACKILVLKGVNVKLVEGSVSNIKLTVPFDLQVALALLGEENNK